MDKRLFPPLTFCLIPNLLLAGCAHPNLEKVRFPQTQLLSPTAYYQTPRLSKHPTIRLVKRANGFLVKQVILPKTSSPIDGRMPLVLDYYLPTGKGPFPLILISPILGGKYRVERSLAEFVVKRGFAVLLVHRKQLRLLPDEGLEQIEEYLRTSVIRLRMALDWVETQKEIDAERIGTLGMSLGGILNVVLAGVDKRAKVHVIAMAGGNLADVICYTHVKAVRQYRNQFMKRQGLTLEGLRQRLRKTLRTDPMHFAHWVASDNVLLFVAWFDMVIGRKYSRKLAKALGNPETFYFPLGHYSSLLTIPFVRIRALHFFEEKLKTAPPAESAKGMFWQQVSLLPHKQPRTQDRDREQFADW